MKKIVASVGLVALGASGLTVANGQDAMTPTPYKPWNVSGSLRGFYDDNINTAVKDSPNFQKAFGVEIAPGVGVDWRTDQSSIKANYEYTLRYYDKKPYGNSVRYDQQHIFTLDLQHAFSERYQIGFVDQFVVGQQPDVLRGSSASTVDAHYISGENIHNDATLTFNATLTPVIALQAGYENSFYDYKASGMERINAASTNAQQIALYSAAGTLNRVENTFHLDLRYLLSPETTAIVGYQYSQADFTGNEIISELGAQDLLGVTYPIPGTAQYSDSRNNRKNTGYVGADHQFNPDLSGSFKVGVSSLDYYKQTSSSGSSASPYVRVSLNYNYLPDSSATIGFSYDKSATDLISPKVSKKTPASTNSPAIYLSSVTLDQESAVIWGEIRHKIDPKLFADLILQYQDSSFNGGQYNNETEQYFAAGLSLQYKFNPNFSASVGYNLDLVSSQVPNRNYTRNRVYIGATASY